MSNLGFRFGLVLVTLPVPALAQSAAAPAAGVTSQQVSLRYSGEPACPSEVEFVSEVTARVRRPVQWSKSGAAVQMMVVVRSVGARATGTLEVVQRSTEPTRREFSAATCEEVGSALALVAALALDPNARTEQLPVHVGTSAASAELPPVAEPTPSVAEPPKPPPRVAEPAPVAEPPPPSTAPAPAPSGGYVVWAGPVASVAGGYASEPFVALGLSLGFRSVRPGFAPGLQLTPLWGKTGTTGPEASGGTFSWAMGRLEGCPVQVALAPSLRFGPCAAAEIGQVSARGAAAGITSVSRDRWWFAAGASLSLHLSLGSWFARLGGLVLIPATRDEFVFRDPNRTIHQASAVVVGGSLGLGFQFGS